eukprot:scaffold58774_cov20-Prasinocladus_malaysianus.AAC.1
MRRARMGRVLPAAAWVAVDHHRTHVLLFAADHSSLPQPVIGYGKTDAMAIICPRFDESLSNL